MGLVKSHSEERGRVPGDIEETLGYRFRDPALLRQALVHRSYAHEAGESVHNEPLEFLGDAVLGFLVAERVVRRRPDLDEGAMTRLRSSLVNTLQLAEEADRAGLGDALLLGRGEEQSGGRRKPTLLADGFEAIVGAMFLDGGMRPVRTLVRRLFGAQIETAAKPGERTNDPKTELQERVQARGWPLPRYRIVEQRGPDHAREFVIEVVVNGASVGTGTGSSKKRAEQAAARAALVEV
jgi:ribonuclease III